MDRKELEVISILGPLGSGKTTALNQLIEKVPLGDSYAVVVNDVGENNIDARRIWDHPANRSEKIIPLTAGCIGCSDVTQFREALEKVHDACVNVLFIEPTGIAPGTEVAEVVRSSGFDLSVLTLTNAKTIERDLKWQVLPSQLAVADIIGITHIPDQRDEAEVMAEVLDQLPPLADDVTMELIKPGDTDYFEILTRLRGMDRQLQFGRGVLTALNGHSHNGEEHDHEHDNHGISAKSFQVRKGTPVGHVRQLLMQYVERDQPLMRAKGVVGTTRFDVVGDEWNTQYDESGMQNMNVIFAGHIPNSFLEKVKDITEAVERLEVQGDKKAIVKSISEMPLSDRIEIAAQRIAQYPHPISPMHGELIPDCEADEGYEIAFWGNHDDMPDDVKRMAMNAYIEFRLSGVHELLDHPDQITNVSDKRAYWLRRLGATLGYNGYYLREYIGDDMLEKVRSINPADMLHAGFMSLDRLTFDEGRAEEKPEFIASVFKAAVENGDISAIQARQAVQHALTLSGENETYKPRWQDAFSFL